MVADELDLNDDSFNPISNLAQLPCFQAKLTTIY